MSKTLGPWLFLLLVCPGCGCGATGGAGDDAIGDDDDACSDLDGDGFGTGAACTGPDCNDYVADIHTDEQCDEFCASNAIAPGCPCSSGEPEVCYLAAPDTLGVGACRAGLTTCSDGLWGPCDGQVLPVDETCDEADNDCDGEVDDGVLSECGTCGECEQDCAGPEEECGGWGDTRSGVAETPEGWLVLDGHTIDLHVIWPSSSGTGEAFRVDTQTYDILGAYWTGPNHGAGGGFGFGGDSPSRSGVDDFGSLVISNRAFGLQGSITKIASDESLCIDQNGNGRIDTSTGWDDKLAFDASDDWEDECILWHTEVGNPSGTPRAVALHQVLGLDGVLEDRGWVGLYEEHRVLEFDSTTGELTGEEAPTPGFTPYGGAIDRDGWMWLSGLLGPVVGRFDTADPEDSWTTVNVPGGSAYRVIVDENNAPWIAGTGIWRWNRDEEAFETVVLAGGGGGGFSSVGNIASDGQGTIWSATYASGEFVYRITNDPGAGDDLENYTIPTPGVQTFGMGCDFDGHCWTFSYFAGNGAVIDVDDDDVENVLDDCGGANCLSTPYVRGDITGLQRRNALNPSGNWSTVVEGCDGGETDWTQVLVDGLTPAGSSLVVSVRTAETVLDLPAAPWVQVGVMPPAESPFDLNALLEAAGVDDAHFLEVQVVLQSMDRATTPTLRNVEVQWGCPIIIG